MTNLSKNVIRKINPIQVKESVNLDRKRVKLNIESTGRCRYYRYAVQLKIATRINFYFSLTSAKIELQFLF
jgi:hypothetical protein